jgi:hypothetical protein
MCLPPMCGWYLVIYLSFLVLLGRIVDAAPSSNQYLVALYLEWPKLFDVVKVDISSNVLCFCLPLVVGTWSFTSNSWYYM